MPKQKIAYYPGCTMKTTCAAAEQTAHTVADAVGYELDELEYWNCCGTVFQLTDDSIMQHVGSMRNLVRAEQAGHDRLTTLCSICYNTMRRVGDLYNSDRDKRERLTAFMDDEEEYSGKVEMTHFLSLLDSEEALEKLKSAVEISFEELKVMGYYGCLLLRPEELALADRENPQLLERIIRVTGAEPVEAPFRTECCGSYKTVDSPDFVAERTYQILSDAANRDADLVITACPLCQFNLDDRQREVEEAYAAFKTLPVVYFTQFLHIALGGDPEKAGFDDHYADPSPVFERYLKSKITS